MFTIYIFLSTYKDKPSTILAAFYLIHKMLFKVLNYQAVISSLKKSYPQFRFFNFYPFESLATQCSTKIIHLSQSKLEPRAIECVFHDNSATQKGYICIIQLKKKSLCEKMRPFGLNPIFEPFLFKERHI